MKLREEYKNNLLNYRYGVYLRYIKDLAKGKKVVAEFGCGNFIVASAIITGVGRGGVYVGVDKKEYTKDEILGFMKAAKRLGVETIIKRGDTRETVLKKADLLVIDTLHNANHLWAELYDHKNIVDTIVVLGTTLYGNSGESEDFLGLDACFTKFLNENPEWEVSYEIDDYRYGLKTLTRKK